MPLLPKSALHGVDLDPLARAAYGLAKDVLH